MIGVVCAFLATRKFWFHSKKSGGILCKGDRLGAYRSMEQHHEEFGVRWLLLLGISPNAYYNYRKHRKSGYCAKKSKVLEQIEEICHSHNGADGYRRMAVYLERRGLVYSPAAIHEYMDRELGLRSIVRQKKPGKPHRVFGNRLKQNFHADRPDQKWCTDFTYLFLKNGDVRYNCTVIDLYDRSVVASITGDLAIRTLRKALDSQCPAKGGLALYSGQGSQYTSKAFVEFCASVHVTQSMSKAGYPYDNAPMERYFNTLKNECTNLYTFRTEEELYRTVEEFAYATYSHVRPHSYNHGHTPYQARMSFCDKARADPGIGLVDCPR